MAVKAINVVTIITRLLEAIAAAMAVAAAFAACAASAPPATTQAVSKHEASVLHVHVVGLRSSDGQVGCTLYNSPTAFPGDEKRAVKDMDAPIKADAAWCNFIGLTPGKYALVVIHDENGNGQFDRDIFGIPEEGYAFSNNVRPMFRPPSFDEASFDYKGGEQWLTITMMY